MSYNDNNVERSARRHRPAIIGILVALTMAAIAFFLFVPWQSEEHAVAPAGAVVEGTTTGDAPAVSPEGAAPTPAKP